VSSKEALEARLKPGMSTAKDIVRIAHSAGVDAAKTGAVIGGGISLIRNTVSVVRGEKEAAVAMAETVVSAGKAAVVSYGTAALGSSLKGAMQNAPDEILRTLSKTNMPTIVVTTALETGKTLKKYIAGEIDGTECLEELGEKGTSMLSSAMFAGQGALAGTLLIPIPGIGTVIGGLIGGMIGYSFSSAYYRELTGALRDAKAAKEERIRVEAECLEAIIAIREYRNEMERIIADYFDEHAQVFHDAFHQMKITYEIGDIDGFIDSANQITRKLGGSVPFNSFQEFEAVINSSQPFKL